jgi:uncharacterized membrane protein
MATATSTSVDLRERVPRWWWPAAVLAVGVAAYSLRYVVMGARAYVPELAPSFSSRPLLVTVHTLFGPIALVCGLTNLLPAMRRRRWLAHRTIGRVYLVSVLLLGLAGLALSPHAAGGLVARSGFFLLALTTLGTAIVGYGRIRRGDVRSHREWMLRSYACIFAAVTLRLWIPILMLVTAHEFLPAYRVVAWLAWVPNLVWVEIVIRRGWSPTVVLDEDSTLRVEATA